MWSVALDQPARRLNLLSQALSADEQQRAGRFHVARDRERYIASRATLRAILGRYLDMKPASLAFTYGKQGKPGLALSHAGGNLEFNLSHSEARALVAVTRGRPVGVDIEAVRPVEEVKDVAARILSARELAEFERLTPAQQVPAFFSVWTRKEALVKATGLGFSTNVAEVEVTFALGQPARLVRLHGDARAAAGWTLRDVPTEPGYAAAVAWFGPIAAVQHLQWT